MPRIEAGSTIICPWCGKDTNEIKHDWVGARHCEYCLGRYRWDGKKVVKNAPPPNRRDAKDGR